MVPVGTVGTYLPTECDITVRNRFDIFQSKAAYKIEYKNKTWMEKLRYITYSKHNYRYRTVPGGSTVGTAGRCGSWCGPPPAWRRRGRGRRSRCAARRSSGPRSDRSGRRHSPATCPGSETDGKFVYRTRAPDYAAAFERPLKKKMLSPS